MKTPQEMIEEMTGAGIRQRAISKMTGIGDSYISALKLGTKGSEMTYISYAALADCYKKLMRKARREGK